jgi:hypothetical protein
MWEWFWIRGQTWSAVQVVPSAKNRSGIMDRAADADERVVDEGSTFY